MNQPIIKLNSAKNFSETINTIFNFAVGNIKPLSLIFLTYAIIPTLLSGIAGASINSNNWNTIFQMMSRGNIAEVPPNLGLTFLTLIGFFIAYTMFSGMVFEYIYLYNKKNGEEVTISETWNRFKEDAAALFGYQILLGIIIAFAAVVMALIFTSIGMASPIITILGIILLFTALIYIGIPLNLFLMVRVSERKGFSDTISRCFKLVKDNWWVTFGLLLIIVMIQAILGSIFNIPQYIYLAIQGISALTGKNPGDINMVAMIIFNTISVLGSMWLYILNSTFIGVHYFSLVEKKDNQSLLNRIESIATEENTEDNN
ncbi:MAG: hypothetical protein JW717_09005 [Marinilabiliaceae bacterium]|nr:hypothetical protein [Marinilabiliaceae bacterium]